MKVFSPALLSGKQIPARCASAMTPGGQNISLPVAWSEVPPLTQSFCLLVVDEHPASHRAVHWQVIDIPFSAREIIERGSGIRDRLPLGCLELRNSFGSLGYEGPRARVGGEPHDYRITIYALSTPSLNLGPFASFEERTLAMEGSVLDTASLQATFIA